MLGGREDSYRDAKVSVLREEIRHHVAEEEKPGSGTFARAKAAGVATAELAGQLQRRKQALQGRPPERPRPVSLELQFANRRQQEEDMPRYQSTPDRDERGRFISDDEDRRSGRGYAARRGRDEREDDEGRGWYGDPEGHSEASRRGWAERRGESRSFSRSRDEDEDDRRYRARASGDRDRDERGRFMSEDDRYSSRGRDDDERRYSSRSRSSERERDDRGRFMSDDDERRYYAARREEGHGGWYGDPEGHSEASRRGWEERSGGYRSREDDDRRSYRSRGRDDEDEDRRGHGGWFGDSRGHSEAARRGWQERR